MDTKQELPADEALESALEQFELSLENERLYEANIAGREEAFMLSRGKLPSTKE